MLFWIMLAVTIVFGVLAYWVFHVYKYNLDIPGTISAIISSLAAIITLGMVVAICIIQLDALGNKESLQVTYKSLTYQMENNLYDNDNDYGKKELYDQITNYNQTVSKGKSYRETSGLAFLFRTFMMTQN